MCRIAIGSFFACPESGGICIIEFEPELFTIGLMLLLMVVLHYSAPHARRWISTYLRKRNGNRMTGKEDNYMLLPLTIDQRNRLLYRPQMVVDGNMKLVHQIQKRPEDDVSLSDGEQYIVKRAPYAEHLAHAPSRQPVSPYQSRASAPAERRSEIQM
jgi:hypothetical protein